MSFNFFFAILVDVTKPNASSHILRFAESSCDDKVEELLSGLCSTATGFDSFSNCLENLKSFSETR
jgi:hypothetical protein